MLHCYAPRTSVKYSAGNSEVVEVVASWPIQSIAVNSLPCRHVPVVSLARLPGSLPRARPPPSPPIYRDHPFAMRLQLFHLSVCVPLSFFSSSPRTLSTMLQRHATRHSIRRLSQSPSPSCCNTRVAVFMSLPPHSNPSGSSFSWSNCAMVLWAGYAHCVAVVPARAVTPAVPPNPRRP